MLSNADKAWAAGAGALVTHYANRYGLGAFVSPELAAVLCGVVVYFVRNKP